MKWTVPRIWSGGTAVILGGGPSITQQFNIPEYVVDDVYKRRQTPAAYSPYLKAIHKQHVIGVNVAYKMGDWVDVVFFGDESTWLEDKENLLKFKGLRVTCSDNLNYIKRLKCLNRNKIKPFGLTIEPNAVSWNGNSGASAINFAIHTGVKRIILLGFDMQVDEKGNQHWHKFYVGDTKTLESTMSNHLKGFPQIKIDADALGVQIINANPSSRIECFPKMNFKDIIL